MFVLVRCFPLVELLWAKCGGKSVNVPSTIAATRTRRTSSPLDRSVVDALLLPLPQRRPLFGVPLLGENDPRDLPRRLSRRRRRRCRRPFRSVFSPPLPSLLPLPRSLLPPSLLPLLPVLRPLPLFFLLLSREPPGRRCRSPLRPGCLPPYPGSVVSRGEAGFAFLFAPARPPPVTTVAAAVPTESGDAGTVASLIFAGAGEEGACGGSTAAVATAAAASSSSPGGGSGGS